MTTKVDPQRDHWSVAATSGPIPLSEEPFEMPFVASEIVADKYEVIELVGVGGVGFVVAATHIELGERVALKFLRPEMLAREDVVARFAQEALAAVRIKNEHVARVLDVGALPDGSPFIVMEYLDGRDLYDVVINEGPQPAKRAVDYVLQACEALSDAHARGIIHRDIKPENLFLIQRSEGIETIKVLDFGISKVALTGSPLTSKVPLVRTMLPMGSPVYMSPEQIRGSKDVDFRTDIWSMGCVLHELLTGRPAFDAPSLMQLSATILEEHPARPSEICPSVPAALDAIVARCLEKSPERRFQNMAELALALYPYGPRRARHSAERCCMLLKVEGALHGEFELPSVRPPGWDILPSGAYPINPSPPEVAARKPLTTIDSAAVEAMRKPRRTALLLGVGLAIVAVLAVALGLIGRAQFANHDEGRRPTPTQPSSPRDVPMAQTAAQLPTDSRNPSPQPRATAAASAPARDVAAPNHSASIVTVPRVPPSHATRNRKKPSGTHQDVAATSEPDPGF